LLTLAEYRVAQERTLSVVSSSVKTYINKILRKPWHEFEEFIRYPREAFQYLQALQKANIDMRDALGRTLALAKRYKGKYARKLDLNVVLLEHRPKIKKDNEIMRALQRKKEYYAQHDIDLSFRSSYSYIHPVYDVQISAAPRVGISKASQQIITMMRHAGYYTAKHRYGEGTNHVRLVFYPYYTTQVPFDEIPRFLYHGTPADIHKIQRDGLKPSNYNRFHDYLPEVWVTTEKSIASQYGRCFEIDTTKLRKGTKFYLPHARSITKEDRRVLITYSHIPPEALTFIDE
jgi:hypothetical protein